MLDHGSPRDLLWCITVAGELEPRVCARPPPLSVCSVQGRIPLRNQNQPGLHLGIGAGMFKLLIPELQQNIPDDDYCLKHLEPTLLFCEDDQGMLCSKCLLSEDHETHMVCGIKEAAENYRVSFLQIPEHSGTMAASSYLLTYLFEGQTINMIL